ncbi:MAG: taurine dioxygenase [Nevskia sp.]
MNADHAALQVKPISPAIGAIVGNLDLAQPLSAFEVERLTQALVAHHVLLFEQQDLSPAQLRDLARNFGALHVHPIYPHVAGVPEIIILDTGAHNLPDNDNWHTDVTFIQTPPLGAILAARELPPCGGDTSWASTIAAYEALSPPLQALLAGLTAEHDFVKSFPRQRFGSADAEAEARWNAAVAQHPPVTHPVIRTHPVSGRRGLFVNEGFTTRIRELKGSESEALLRLLFAHVARPEFTMRWRWKPGDVAFWDNRLTQHYALADYLPARRVMHRATILGDRPV